MKQLGFLCEQAGLLCYQRKLPSSVKDWKLDLRVNEHTQSWRFLQKKPPESVEPPGGLWAASPCILCGERGADVNELAEVGGECEPIRVDDYTGKKMTFFHDPDGLPLELHE